jgi:short-subunit dehydrogenase
MSDPDIVVTGSEHSIGVPFGGSAVYTATKHATLAMAEVMREEWAELPVDISIPCLGLTQSRFWESDRHGEDVKTEANPMAAAVLGAGMPAAKVAEICLDGVERGDSYIFTHSHVEAYGQKRFDEITDAFAVLNRTAPTDRSYDVGKVVADLMTTAEKR